LKRSLKIEFPFCEKNSAYSTVPPNAFSWNRKTAPWQKSATFKEWEANAKIDLHATFYA
jgi:hypothetical protein